MNKRSSPGFTLVELLTVMAIVLILAGMVMVTMSYTTGKAARVRAEGEKQALSVACENYKTDNGGYPQDKNLTDNVNMDPNSGPGAVTDITAGSYYCKSAFWLYASLTGDYNGDGVTDPQDGIVLYNLSGNDSADASGAHQLLPRSARRYEGPA
ncbi:MAG: type II secretion system protein [Chthoniobacteraceae bacterium]